MLTKAACEHRSSTIERGPARCRRLITHSTLYFWGLSALKLIQPPTNFVASHSFRLTRQEAFVRTPRTEVIPEQ